MNRILFLKAVTSLGVPQGGDGDHLKIYTWQGLVVCDEYRQQIAFALASSQNLH